MHAGQVRVSKQKEGVDTQRTQPSRGLGGVGQQGAELRCGRHRRRTAGGANGKSQPDAGGLYAQRDGYRRRVRQRGDLGDERGAIGSADVVDA